MNRAGPALSVILAATLASGVAPAETDRPVFVTVEGHGALRFRLAAGPTSPCDATTNRMLFDGWLQPGRYRWATGSEQICFQQTSGELRESNWSPPRVVSTRMRGGGGRRTVRPTELVLSSE